MGASPIPLTPGQPAPLAPGEFQGASKPQVYSFLTEKVTPPSFLYVQRDDELVVEAITSLANLNVTFRARLLEPSGVIQPIAQNVFSSVVGATQQLRIPLSEGFLLSVVCVSVGATNRGITFVRAFLNRGALALITPNASQILFADYVTDVGPVGWPGGRVLSPLEGPGQLFEPSTPNPAAGVDWIYTVPAGVRDKVRAVRSVLTTSAVVANRFPVFLIQDGSGNNFAATGNNNAQIASQTIGYTLGIGMSAAQVGPTDFIAPLPGEFLLPSSSVIRSATGGLLAGDQWSAIIALTERWVSLENG